MGTCSQSSDEEEEEEGTIWEYEDDNKLWMPMDASVIKTIQQAYNSNKKLLEIRSNYGFKYKIDFKKMTQTNTISGKSRNIRQHVKQKSKGIAVNQNIDILRDKTDDIDIDVDSSADQLEENSAQIDLLNDTSDDDEDGDFMDQFQSTGKNLSDIKYDYTQYKEVDAENWNKTKIYDQPVGQSRDEMSDELESSVADNNDILSTDSENDDTALLDDDCKELPDALNDKTDNINKKSMNISVGRWQWCDDGATWKDYDSVKNTAIEDAYKNGKNIYSIFFGGKKYELRLNELKQYNVMTKFTRNIRRISVDNIKNVNKHSKVKAVLNNGTRDKRSFCWQWKDDDGYKDYSLDICNEIESVYVNNGTNGYGNVLIKKFGTQSYDIKPFQMVQVNKATQYKRAIRRVNINDKNEDKLEKIMKWQWCDDGPKWKDYDKIINKAIEKSYANSKKNHQFTIKSKTYEIKFNKLKQCNVSSNFERDVRRVTVKNNTVDGVRNMSTNNNFVSGEAWIGPKRKTFGDEIKTLYHVTNKKAADAIAKSGRMIRGSDGMFGGGIYFAENQNSATYKSEHKGGWVITAKVLVGKTFVAKDANAGKFDFYKLQSIGYDSVHAPNGSGKGKSERVVYNWDQVCVVSVTKAH